MGHEQKTKLLCRKNIFIGIYRFYRRLAIDISGHETKKVYRDSHILKPSKMLVYLIYYRRNYFFMGGSVIRLLQ